MRTLLQALLFTILLSSSSVFFAPSLEAQLPGDLQLTDLGISVSTPVGRAPRQ